ncbi:NAD-binding protein [Spirillospora sp. NPDC048824]|uniref:NAD-binding protein n=1 Tax=Spirillospora sp. NPDC048824 TaxID=3364526 RepID=UPI003721B2B0
MFDLDEAPRSLVGLGGGTTGCELAQASGRLGVEVTDVESAARLLPQEDPDASGVIAEEVFAREGVIVHTRACVTAADLGSGGIPPAGHEDAGAVPGHALGRRLRPATSRARRAGTPGGGPQRWPACPGCRSWRTPWSPTNAITR